MGYISKKVGFRKISPIIANIDTKRGIYYKKVDNINNNRLIFI